MIASFGHNETKLIWDGFISKKFPQNIQQVARRKLTHIHSAVTINDLRVPPGNRLEKLKGNYEEYYSIRINNQFRIIFKWHNGMAFEVQIIDYH